jgi:thimet oligopeptidase
VKKGNVLIGNFYMDLFSREGKYGHAAVFDLVSGFEGALPLGALVVNFDNGEPRLLSIGEMSRTLLHELGHVLHLLLSGYRLKYSEFSGFNVKMDFVEAPSQMLENWGSLEMVNFSKHYKTGEKIPQELVNKIVESSKFGRYRSWMGTVFYSMYDQVIHQTKWSLDEKIKLWRNMEIQLLNNASASNGKICRIANWGHLASSGYGSLYYSYIWSKVIALNLFSKFVENDMHRDIYKEYVEKILESGSLYPESEIIEDFLGREISLEYFYEYLDGNYM